MNTTISKLRNYAHQLRKWKSVLSIGHRVIELCHLFIILPIENCIPITRNALSIEAVGRRANNVLLPHSIQAWENDCWSNKVIEEQLDQRHSLNSTAWVVGLASSQPVQARPGHMSPPSALEQVIKDIYRAEP